MLIGKARYHCSCMVRYAEAYNKTSNNRSVEKRWLIVGFSVGFGVLLILTVIVVIVMVSCCGRRRNHHHRQESSAEETCRYTAGFIELDNPAMAIANKEHYENLGEQGATGKTCTA